MSEILQSGHHPDADQLNAFVEHALPPHEHEQMFTHLAICSDCRTVVALLLPPVETSPVVQPERARKRWLSGWNLAWPAAAAMAGLVVVIVHIHNASSTQSGAVTPTQMAAAHPPVPLASTTIAPPSPLSSKPQRPIPRPTSGGNVPRVLNPQKSVAVMDAQGIASLPMQNRNVTSQVQPTGSTGGTIAASSRLNPSASSSIGTGALFQNAPVTSTDHPQQTFPIAGSVALASPSAPAPAAPVITSALKQNQPSAIPGPLTANDMLTVRALNQTAVETSAAPGTTLSSSGNGPILGRVQNVPVRQPLPSHLPALSTASNAHMVLAIDTQNTLFFSDDDGEHWKTIPSQWQGHAVKVIPTSSTISPGRRFTTPTSSFAAIGGPISSPARITGSTLAGTVTDASGAAIPDASVVVGNATASIARTVTTDRSGRYLVDNLVPGSYQVEAQAPGFNKQRLAVTISASQQSLANLTLPVGHASESVTVEASAIAPAIPTLTTKIAEPTPLIQPIPLFEMTTDTGDHWTSNDGQTWKRK
jgi:Carboxypeptidase regulatory-like domain/Putative zinc-finger